VLFSKKKRRFVFNYNGVIFYKKFLLSFTRMRHITLYIVSLLIPAMMSLQAQVYQTKIHNEQIRTLTVYPGGDWSTIPVIELGTDNYIEISFDELSHDYKRFAYRIIHCNADWTRSDMNEQEYLDGFSENNIDNGDQSVSTLTIYTHYKFSLPNDKVNLKLSGNYAVEVFDREGTGEPLLTACFMILESKVSIEGSVTATTDVDYKQESQQLNFNIRTLGMSIQQPLAELKVKAQQNHRKDNEVLNLVPIQVSSNVVSYEHNKDLIFKAGNEYRRFETTSYKYATLGVYKISYFKPFYNVELMPAEPRLKGYVYDKDQNGRFLIHSQDVSDELIGSDYFLVHFSLPMDTPILDGGIFLNGDFVNNSLDTNSKMIYNFERKAYEKNLLLKQGAYNFQYLFCPTKSFKSTPQRIEGSYWQTENEYQIYVYYRPVGERYDRLIGYKQIQTTF
jgi:hypothetical protein